VVHAGAPGVPAEVLAALEPGPGLLVRVREGDRTTAYLVASAARRDVEVFHLADPRLGYPDGLVLAAAHFRDADGRAFHDRLRRSPPEDAEPNGRIRFCEEILYREPNTAVFREELRPGEVHEHVHPAVDLSDRYLPWPAPGDWAPFLTFPSSSWSVSQVLPG
jgi:hypothetical protein